LNSKLAGLVADRAGIEQQSETRERLGEKLAGSQAARQGVFTVARHKRKRDEERP
jgi:hypothetical protein